MTKVKVFLVFGPQGSGKSTQGEMLAQRLRIPYFDAGDALRALAKGGTELGQSVRESMQSGKLVSNKVLRQLFVDFMNQHNCERGLVADGFPRNIVQAELLSELCAEHHWEIVAFYIHISDQTAKERLAKRFTIVNGQKVVRQDDQPAIVEKRLQTFREQTLPVLDWLKDHHRLIRIDGEPDVEAVQAQIAEEVEKL